MKKYFLFIMSFISFEYITSNDPSVSQKTSEVRAYIYDIDNVKNVLLDLDADFKSEYVFTDYIYEPKNAHRNLDIEFIRLRVYEKTNWDQKKCVLVHKKKTTQGITGNILMHQEFDSTNQAQEKLKHDYKLLFSFSRIGWQYTLQGNQIFVEDIEHLNPTIEIVASHRDMIDDLFETLSITNVIEHSVPYLVQEIMCKSN